MEYTGKLYCKLGGKYIELEETSKDFDNLKAENKKLKQQINNFNIAGIINRYVMCKSWFEKTHPTKNSEHLIAECPCCGGVVYYNDGCENCKSDFIFND